MGRSVKAGGSDSGRGAGERRKNIGKPRTKRRKRKDLEELHRNVLEAKRNLRVRAPGKKKKETALGKVLKNFADKRQENEETSHGIEDKKGKKSKSRTICNRLLPEPILGIYQNGAKGREVRANREFDKINAARLEDDVLKLLNSGETNPKFSWSGNEKRTKKAKVDEAFSSNQSDYTSSSESQTNTPVHGKTKGVKLINGEKKKTNLITEKLLANKNNDQQEFHKKEKNCKRRLFESNEDQTDRNCLGNNENFLMGEIRFSPSRSIVRNVSPLENGLSEKKHHMDATELERRKKIEKKFVPVEATIDANFWGWSPIIYYERLCAMICADNFENNRGEQPRGSDPIVKIRRSLRDFYRNACRCRHPVRKTVIAKGNKHQEHELSKVTLSLEDSCLPSATEIQACTATSTDSEFVQVSSASDATKVGSWRPRHFGKIVKSSDSSVLHDSNVANSESSNHNKESQSKEDKPTFVNKQNRNCKKTADRVEKTIHSVSLFLEKLRENNPLNEKRNIFQMEVDAARLSGQKEHLTDCIVENPCRDFTFDRNLKNLVRKNTKHVPTILRRSNNGRCGLVEKLDEKQTLNNLAYNGLKRSTRTIATLPRNLHSKLDDNDDLQTPSVVNHLGVMKKAKANILKSKLNFMRAKYRNDSRSLPLEYKELEELRIIDERKISASQNFVNESNIDNREWYHSNILHRDGKHDDSMVESRKEEERDSKRVHIGKKNITRNFEEPNHCYLETDYPQSFVKYQLPNVCNETPHLHTETTSSFSSFEFARPDVPKNTETCGRQIFTNEMENIVSQRLSGENNQETLVRSRYLPDNTKISVSRLSNLQCTNKMKFPSEEYVECIPAVCSDMNNDVKNRSFKILPSYHGEDGLSFDRVPMNETAGYAQRCRGIPARQNIRKPVMLFRPIQETRRQQQQQEIYDSRYRLSENNGTTINDAVRDFRILTFDDSTKNPLNTQLQACSEMLVHYQPQQQQQQIQSLSQPHCHRKLNNNRQKYSQEFDKRPTKYLALDDDGRNPRRLPIYVNSNASQASNSAIGIYNCDGGESTKSFDAFAKIDNTEIMRCDVESTMMQNASTLQCCGQQQQELGNRRASQVTLVLPYNAKLCQQTSNLSTTSASTNIKDIPRVVYSMEACGTLVPPEMTYKLEPPLYAQSRYDNESSNLSKRVQLPDGRVGILVTENCSIDKREHVDSNGATKSSFERIDVGNLNERSRSALANEKIYY